MGYPTRDRTGIRQAGTNADGLSTVSEERLNPVEEIAGNAITLEFVYKFRVRNGVKCSLEVNVEGIVQNIYTAILMTTFGILLDIKTSKLRNATYHDREMRIVRSPETLKLLANKTGTECKAHFIDLQ